MAAAIPTRPVPEPSSTIVLFRRYSGAILCRYARYRDMIYGGQQVAKNGPRCSVISVSCCCSTHFTRRPGNTTTTGTGIDFETYIGQSLDRYSLLRGSGCSGRTRGGDSFQRGQGARTVIARSRARAGMTDHYGASYHCGIFYSHVEEELRIRVKEMDTEPRVPKSKVSFARHDLRMCLIHSSHFWNPRGIGGVST